MPVKKVIDMPERNQVQTVVFDETHAFGDFQLRFVIDLATIQDDIEQYMTRLRKHRKVHNETALEFLDYNDLAVQVAEQNFEEIEDDDERMEMAIEYAKDHYRELLEVIRNEAFILALTVENDFSNIEVVPYQENDKKRILPGVGKKLPLPNRDIRFATEKRLSQLYNVLSKDLAKWESLKGRIIVKFSQVMKNQGESRLDGSTF